MIEKIKPTQSSFKEASIREYALECFERIYNREAGDYELAISRIEEEIALLKENNILGLFYAFLSTFNRHNINPVKVGRGLQSLFLSYLFGWSEIDPSYAHYVNRRYELNDYITTSDPNQFGLYTQLDVKMDLEPVGVRSYPELFVDKNSFRKPIFEFYFKDKKEADLFYKIIEESIPKDRTVYIYFRGKLDASAYPSKFIFESPDIVTQIEEVQYDESKDCYFIDAFEKRNASLLLSNHGGIKLRVAIAIPYGENKQFKSLLKEEGKANLLTECEDAFSHPDKIDYCLEEGFTNKTIDPYEYGPLSSSNDRKVCEYLAQKESLYCFANLVDAIAISSRYIHGDLDGSLNMELIKDSIADQIITLEDVYEVLIKAGLSKDRAIYYMNNISIFSRKKNKEALKEFEGLNLSKENFVILTRGGNLLSRSEAILEAKRIYKQLYVKLYAPLTYYHRFMNRANFRCGGKSFDIDLLLYGKPNEDIPEPHVIYWKKLLTEIEDRGIKFIHTDLDIFMADNSGHQIQI